MILSSEQRAQLYGAVSSDSVEAWRTRAFALETLDYYIKYRVESYERIRAGLTAERDAALDRVAELEAKVTKLETETAGLTQRLAAEQQLSAECMIKCASMSDESLRALLIRVGKMFVESAKS
jgi:hypothetical protein